MPQLDLRKPGLASFRVSPVSKSADAGRPVTRAQGSAPPRGAKGMTARIYAIMGLTTFTTFATLETIHQLFFTHSVFA